MYQSKPITNLNGVWEPRRTSKSGVSMRRWVQLLGLACLLLNAYGCMTYHGLTPLSPLPGYPASPITIPSLQPVLEWEPCEETEPTYDVFVVEGLQGDRLYNPGKPVFYREGITENKVKIEPPLVFDRLYWWSVRTRNGDKVSEWSSYDSVAMYGNVSVTARNYPYPFRTPVNANGVHDDPTSP